MSEYQKILAVVDLTPSARQVGRRAAAVASRMQAGLTFLHVVDFIPPPNYTYEAVPISDLEIDEEQLVKQAEEGLAGMVQELNMEGVTTLVRRGPAKRVIVDTAREIGVDLIITGSHGRHGFGLLLGSTANSILHHAECDVLAVRIRDA